MTAAAIGAALACQLPLVGGQVLLKRGSRRPSWLSWWLAGGIACLTLWFLLWLGLLQRYGLSRLYPFEGLNPALVVVGAVVAGERLGSRAWLGVALICCGVALVAAS